MRKLKSLSLVYDGTEIRILDQTQLPQKQEWLLATDSESMISHIQNLRVRGAPLIGIASALVLGKAAESGASEDRYRKMAKALLASRPTAVNLQNAVNRMTDFRVGDLNVRKVVETSEKIFLEDVELCDRIASNGSSLIGDGQSILTHCNTGGLATTGVGTAIGVLRKAHESKKQIHVYVSETRPLLQGGRLTAWEMGQLNIPHTLICDNMAASLMEQNKIASVIVGCDRIALNGDFANKVGTYSLAVLAKYHNIPFYVAGPHTTIDLHCESGRDIPIEQRDRKEVTGAKGAFGDVQWAPENTPVYNPSFDVTPAHLVTSWILDKKILNSDDVRRGGLIECTLS